jgi:hypothetical protein
MNGKPSFIEMDSSILMLPNSRVIPWVRRGRYPGLQIHTILKTGRTPAEMISFGDRPSALPSIVVSLTCGGSVVGIISIPVLA